MEIIGKDKLCTRVSVGTHKFMFFNNSPLGVWGGTDNETTLRVFNSEEERNGFFKTLSRRSGITILEIIVAGLIVSVLATSAGMGYMKTIEHAAERRAVHDLKLILAAEVIHKIRHNTPFPSNPGQSARSLAEINAGLDINIPQPDNMVYQCHNINMIVSCEVTYRDKWTVRGNNYRNEYYCNDGPCPECLPAALGGCP